ncbi:MAG: nucleotidyltransferase domain-containing protein [Anaerolineae bacterium]|nr:nucleotidyltransferase domain-containing protein [Anaerolineae bacterium]
MNTLKLQPNEREALRTFIRQIRADYPKQVVQTILFGSKARGDSTPDSDIDVLVILKEEDGPIRNQILTIASRISLDYNVLLNPIIASESRYQRQQGFTFYQNATRDAVRLTLKRGQLTFAPGMPPPRG